MQKVTVRSATVCHDGLLFISACHHVPLAARPPATCALGESQSDTLAGELERGHAVGVSHGKLLAAAVVLSRPPRRILPGRRARRGKLSWYALNSLPGKLLLPGSCLFPARSSCRGLVWPSRQAPLVGALVRLPGKLLLPGPCLLDLNTLFLNGSKRATEYLGGHPASLAAGCCNCPCTSSGY